MRAHSNHYSIRKTNISTLSDHTQKPFTAETHYNSLSKNTNENLNNTILHLKGQINLLTNQNVILKAQLAKYNNIIDKQDEIISLDYNPNLEQTIANNKIKRHLFQKQETIEDLQMQLASIKKLTKSTLNQELTIELQQYKSEAKKLRDSLVSLHHIIFNANYEPQEKQKEVLNLIENLYQKNHQLQQQKDEQEEYYKMKINKLMKQLDLQKQRIEYYQKRSQIEYENIKQQQQFQLQQQEIQQQQVQQQDLQTICVQPKQYDNSEIKEQKINEPLIQPNLIQFESEKKKTNGSFHYEPLQDSIQVKHARIQTENPQNNQKNKYISPPIPFHKLTSNIKSTQLQNHVSINHSQVAFSSIQAIGTTLKYSLINTKIQFSMLEKYLFKESDPVVGRTSAQQIFNALKKFPFNMKDEKEIGLICQYLVEEDNNGNGPKFTMSITQDNIIIRSVLRKIIGEYSIFFEGEQISTMLQKIKKNEMLLRNNLKNTSRGAETLTMEQISKSLSESEIHLTRHQLDYLISKLIVESIDINNLRYELIFKLI